MALNSANALTTDCVALILTDEGGDWYDYANDVAPSADTSTAVTGGRAYSGSQGTQFAHLAAYNVLDALTLAAIVTFSGISNSMHLVQKGASGTTNVPYEWRLSQSNSYTRDLLLRANTDYAFWAHENSPYPTSVTDKFFAVSQAGGTNPMNNEPVMIYDTAALDPVDVVAGALQAGAATGNSGDLYIGKRSDSGTAFTGTIKCIAIWSRVVSESDLQTFKANPRALIEGFSSSFTPRRGLLGLG